MIFVRLNCFISPVCQIFEVGFFYLYSCPYFCKVFPQDARVVSLMLEPYMIRGTAVFLQVCLSLRRLLLLSSSNNTDVFLNYLPLSLISSLLQVSEDIGPIAGAWLVRTRAHANVSPLRTLRALCIPRIPLILTEAYLLYPK